MKVNDILSKDEYEYVLTQDFIPSIMSATGYASNDLRAGTRLKIISIRSPYVYFCVLGQLGALFRMSKTEWNDNTFKGTIRDWHKQFMKNLKEEEELKAGDIRYAHISDRTGGTASCYYETENSRDLPITVDAYLVNGDKVTIRKIGVEWETPIVWFEIEAEPFLYFMSRTAFLANTVEPICWKEIQRDWMKSLKDDDSK